MQSTMNKSGNLNEMLGNRQNENLKTCGLYNLGNSNNTYFTNVILFEFSLLYEFCFAMFGQYQVLL